MRSGTTVAGDSGTAMVFAYITPSDPRIKACFPRLTAAGYRANVSKLSSTEEGVMSEAASAPAAGGELGERRLGTIHAVAQALAIGPMFSTAVVLGFVSAPVTGAGFNTALAVLVAGLGVLAIAYAISLFARQYQGAGAVYEYLRTGRTSRDRHLSPRAFSSWAHCSWVVAASTWALASSPTSSGPSTSRHRPCRRGGSCRCCSWRWSLALNYIGVRIAIGAMLTFAAVSFTPMLILAVAIIVQGGEQHALGLQPQHHLGAAPCSTA